MYVKLLSNRCCATNLSTGHYPATTSCSGGRGQPGRGSKLVEIFQKGENNLLCTINNTSVYRNAISKEYFSVFVSLVEKFSNWPRHLRPFLNGERKHGIAIAIARKLRTPGLSA